MSAQPTPPSDPAGAVTPVPPPVDPAPASAAPPTGLAALLARRATRAADHAAQADNAPSGTATPGKNRAPGSLDGTSAADDAADADDPAAALAPEREMPRFAGLSLFGLVITGIFLFPLLSILAGLFSLPYFAAMFGVLFFLCLGGIVLLEFVRLRGWRYSVREGIAAWLVLFLVLVICTGLGYKQYRLSWAAEKPVAVEYWTELSAAQKHLLAEELVSGRIRPTLAELIEFRKHADLKPRQVVFNNRFVQEFAFAIGPWKLLGQECLVVRIDRDQQSPIYAIELVDTGQWE